MTLENTDLSRRKLLRTTAIGVPLSVWCFRRKPGDGPSRECYRNRRVLGRRDH